MAIVIPGTQELRDGLLNKRLGGSESASTLRSAMVFTSTLRQASHTQSTDADPAVAIEAARALTNVDAADAEQIRIISSAYGYASRSLDRFISMQVNPKSIQFIQPKRITKTDTQGGSAFFHFTNRKGQNNGILTIRFRGNTGNIDLRGSLGDTTQIRPATDGNDNAIARQAAAARGPDTGALKKFLTWINLYLLTREPVIIGNGIENKFAISYQSALFPTMVDFVGFFENVLEFEEVAEKPNSRDYQMGFIVERTEPDLDTYMLDLLTQLDTTNLNQPAEGGSSTSGGFV